MHRDRGTAYISAPVFGQPDAAAPKMLFVLCAEDDVTCRRARPLLDAVGQKVFQLGADPVHANIVKLGVNFMIIAAIESMILNNKYGVPRQQMIDVLPQSIFAEPLFVNYGNQIASDTNRRRASSSRWA